MSNKWVVVSSTGWQPRSSSVSTTASANVASGQRDLMPYDDPQVAGQYLPPLHRGRRPGTASAPTSSTIPFTKPVKLPARSAASSPSPARQAGSVGDEHSSDTASKPQTQAAVPSANDHSSRSTLGRQGGYLDNSGAPHTFANLALRLAIEESYPVYVRFHPGRDMRQWMFERGHPGCAKTRYSTRAYEIYLQHIINRHPNEWTGLVAYRENIPPQVNWPHWRLNVRIRPGN